MEGITVVEINQLKQENELLKLELAKAKAQNIKILSENLRANLEIALEHNRLIYAVENLLSFVKERIPDAEEYLEYRRAKEAIS